jgi:hypothetical protein
MSNQWLTSLFRLPLIALFSNEQWKAMSQHTPKERTRIYSDRPFVVYTNLGNEDNFVPVKQFASLKEAEDWIDFQSAERPGSYAVIRQSDFDTAL